MGKGETQRRKFVPLVEQTSDNIARLLQTLPWLSWPHPVTTSVTHVPSFILFAILFQCFSF